MQVPEKTKIKIFIFALLLLICVIIFKQTDCYSNYVFPVLKKIPLVGLLTAYNFPPSDYYDSMVLLPIDQGEMLSTFRCKYEGRYQMRIKNVQFNSFRYSGVSVCGEIDSMDGNSFLRFNDANSELFICDDGYNYHYTHFFVPEEVPLNTPLRIKIHFSGEIDRLLKMNPNAMFELLKWSDK